MQRYNLHVFHFTSLMNACWTFQTTYCVLSWQCEDWSRQMHLYVYQEADTEATFQGDRVRETFLRDDIAEPPGPSNSKHILGRWLLQMREVLWGGMASFPRDWLLKALSMAVSSHSEDPRPKLWFELVLCAATHTGGGWTGSRRIISTCKENLMGSSN